MTRIKKSLTKELKKVGSEIRELARSEEFERENKEFATDMDELMKTRLMSSMKKIVEGKGKKSDVRGLIKGNRSKIDKLRERQAFKIFEKPAHKKLSELMSKDLDLYSKIAEVEEEKISKRETEKENRRRAKEKADFEKRLPKIMKKVEEMNRRAGLIK